MTTAPDLPGPTGPDEPPTGRPSVGELFSRLSEQVARLVRAEIDLAKAELSEKMKHLGAGVGLLAAAGFVAFFALGVLVATIVLALCEAFAPWLAALLTFVILLLMVGALAGIGVKLLKRGVPPTPEKAISGIKQDADILSTLKEGTQR